jgi:hypothetical protein
MTGAVWMDLAVADPSAFEAVTLTRIVWPASAPTSVYVFCVPLAAFLQPFPPPLQRSHWYAYDVGELVQTPFSAVSVWPTVGAPTIVGGVVFVGAARLAA